MACTTAMKVEVNWVWWCRVFRAVITAWGWEGRGRLQQGPRCPLSHTCVVMGFTHLGDVISGQVARKNKLGQLSLLGLIGAGGLALIAQGLKIAQEVGMRVICSWQRTPANIHSVMTQEIQAFIPGHSVAPTL